MWAAQGAPKAGGSLRGAAPSTSAADRVREDYKSEESVALHEVRTLPAGREVYVQLGGVYLLADAQTAERRLQQQQQEQQQQHGL
ncbi:hypothetical protein Efla_000797 [Eimeria flavescens]